MTMTLRLFDQNHRGPVFESELHPVMLDNGSVVLHPLIGRTPPAKAAFAEVWQDDRRVLHGACSIADGAYDVKAEVGMTVAEVHAYADQEIRKVTAMLENRLQQAIDRLQRGDD